MFHCIRTIVSPSAGHSRKNKHLGGFRKSWAGSNGLPAPGQLGVRVAPASFSDLPSEARSQEYYAAVCLQAQCLSPPQGTRGSRRGLRRFGESKWQFSNYSARVWKLCRA
ncbi:hypothetical protein E2C01_068606 [Portunus trituberculatus]|uniref:Uncharacterized protein n=1 Tax=Portunus trituberculatus TaxID=210409 RepID=A0A5B7HSF3_PORTR|nr:hypothetical protein [Portunus trituberculatus]